MTEQPVTETPEKKANWREKTLKAAGYGYMLGDASMFAGGMLRAKQAGKTFDAKGEILAGALWFAGGVAAARYGNPSAEKQLALFAQGLEAHLNQQGIIIPKDARAQHVLLKQPNLWQKCESFFYHYPSELLNACFGIGSVLLLKGGIEKSIAAHGSAAEAFKLSNLGKVHNHTWMGALIAAGAIGGLLIKEDPLACEKAKDGNAFERFTAKIKEKPLRLTGSLYAANNFFTLRNALVDVKAARASGEIMHPYLFTTLTTASYILSNIMLYSSRRDSSQKGEIPKGQLERIEAAAASIIVSQPPEIQNAVLQDISAYMATQKGIKLKAPEIAAQLSQRIAAITEERLQPSVNQVKWAHREEARQHAPHADMAPLAGR